MIEIIPNLHPALVHFPIAFTTAALAFTGIGSIFKNWPYAEQCLITGRWMLWGAALFALITAMFGWIAFNSVEHDEVSHVAMILHRNWALGTLTALLMLTAWDAWRGPSAAAPSYGFLVALVGAWLLVTSTAWHGAELVYRHGIGVMALPNAEGPGHPHQHGDMPMQGEAMPHDDVHAHSHDDTANSRQPHNMQPATPAAGGAGMVPDKAGHTHAPGTPPHQD